MAINRSHKLWYKSHSGIVYAAINRKKKDTCKKKKEIYQKHYLKKREKADTKRMHALCCQVLWSLK